jgi:hypothetical protein
MDELEWMFGVDNGHERCYYDDQRNGGYDYGIWAAGCCCECGLSEYGSWWENYSGNGGCARSGSGSCRGFVRRQYELGGQVMLAVLGGHTIRGSSMHGMALKSMERSNALL